MGNIYIDITEILKTEFISGIQRVVREFTRRLIVNKNNIILISNIQETDDYWIVRNEQFLSFCENETVYQDEYSEIIKLSYLDGTDIFFDMDSVWNKFDQRRQQVYDHLHKRGVKIMTLVYDILPITFPMYFHEDTVVHFILYLSAVLTYSDVVVVNSNTTKKLLEELCLQRKIPAKKICVVPLGADFSDKGETNLAAISERVLKAAEQPYLMMMGTLEPRKNHKLLLDAFDRGLNDLPINIVIAGRIGWNVDSLIDRIRNHPKLDERVFFIEKPSDDEVRYLYQHAYGLVFASFGEGYGLPLVEAMHYGKLVFASDISVFREIGKNGCLYFDPYRADTLVEQVKAALNNQYISEEYKERIKKLHVTTWEEATDMMEKTLENEEKDRNHSYSCSEVNLVPNQLFMISARTEDILETLPFFEHFMPYINELVIGCPQRLIDVIQLAYKGRLKLTFLSDEMLLDGRPLPKDHQAHLAAAVYRLYTGSAERD